MTPPMPNLRLVPAQASDAPDAPRDARVEAPKTRLDRPSGVHERAGSGGPDESDAHAALGGSRAAGEPSLERLYEEFAPYVAALASRILGRASEVDDVVQDVFALAVKGLRRRDNRHEMKGWFAKVTVRLCTRQLRVRRVWALVDLAADPSYDRLPDPGASVEERQLIVEVYRALDRLPAVERVPWTLRNVEGQQLEDVALLCNCSLATAKRRVASAHEKLNLFLSGRGR
jgi:RNA polymerase sigma-70 factor (ECF subfamily)